MLSRKLKAANPPPPSSRHGNRDEIGDELADHLACSKSELEESGLTEREADVEARQRFGNVEKVSRELFWIQHGDQIMAQRIMWAALVVVIAAIGGLFWNQQRNTAELTAAIKTLTSQISKTTPYRETVAFFVTDLQGKPKAGFSFTVVASSNSPPADFYSRELQCGPNGVAESPDMPEGNYLVSANTSDNDNFVRINGPEFRVRAQKPTNRIEFEVPEIVPVTLTFQTPTISNWKSDRHVSLTAQGRFRNSNVNWQAVCENGVPCSLKVPLGVTATCHYNYEIQSTGDRRSNGGREFNALQIVWPADSIPKSGTEITLGPPNDGQSILAEDGTRTPIEK